MEILCDTCKNTLTAEMQFCPNCGAATIAHYTTNGGSPSEPTDASALTSDFHTVPEQELANANNGSNATEDGLKIPYGSVDPYTLNPYNIIPPPPPPQRRARRNLIIGIIGAGVLVPLLILASIGASALINQRARNASAGSITGSITATTSSASASPSITSTSGNTSPVTATAQGASAATVLTPTPTATVAPYIAPTATTRPIPTPTPTIVLPSCGPAFSDNFQNSLHSGWNWVDPANHGTYNVTAPGTFTITSATSSDLNSTTNNDAPRLVQSISGNFTLETQIALSKSLPPGFVAAGILIWQDQNNFLRIEQSPTTFDFEQEVNGVFSHDAPQSLAAATITAPVAELQIQKQGDSWAASWRIPGQSWQYINTASVHLQNIQVGLFLVNQATSGTSSDFHYFHVKCS